MEKLFEIYNHFSTPNILEFRIKYTKDLLLKVIEGYKLGDLNGLHDYTSLIFCITYMFYVNIFKEELEDKDDVMENIITIYDELFPQMKDQYLHFEVTYLNKNDGRYNYNVSNILNCETNVIFELIDNYKLIESVFHFWSSSNDFKIETFLTIVVNYFKALDGLVVDLKEIIRKIITSFKDSPEKFIQFTNDFSTKYLDPVDEHSGSIIHYASIFFRSMNDVINAEKLTIRGDEYGNGLAVHITKDDDDADHDDKLGEYFMNIFGLDSLYIEGNQQLFILISTFLMIQCEINKYIERSV